MYRGRKTHFGRNYFAKNIIPLKKQQKKDGMICEHITPPMVILYFFASHSPTNRPGIVFILDLGFLLYSVPKTS